MINNSGEYGYSPEYIYGFSVTNPLANEVQDWTTEKGWVASKTPLLGHPKTSFAYATIPGFFTFGHGSAEFHVNPETIGPGEQASDFFFGTNLLASSVTLLLVDGNGRFTTDTIASSVPEPATWAMMILGFMGVGSWPIAERAGRRAFAWPKAKDVDAKPGYGGLLHFARKRSNGLTLRHCSNDGTPRGTAVNPSHSRFSDQLDKSRLIRS